MKKLIVGLSIIASTGILSAAVTSLTTIKNIYTYENYIVIKMANSFSNTYNCTSPNSTTSIYLKTDTEAGKRMFAAVLTAKASGSKLKIAYNGCAYWGSKTIPKAYNITLY